MLLLTLIGWLLEKLEERKWDKERAKWSAPPSFRDKYPSGYVVPTKLVEKTRGVNVTGKYNDVW